MTRFLKEVIKFFLGPQEIDLPIPAQSKTDLERVKLYLELKREFKKNIWWYLTKLPAVVPIATLIVTGYILWNQTQILKSQSQIEERRLESEIAKLFATTVKDLDAESKSTRLGAVLALENFIKRDEHYRGQVYLLLGAKLRDETFNDTTRSEVLINQILETFRKVSIIRLAGSEPDSAITLLFEGSHFVSLNLLRFDLRAANLIKANFNGANLTMADLSGSDLTGANLIEAKLLKTNLSRAILSGARLGEAELSGADLSRADFSGADLIMADLTGANLSGGSDFSGADLIDADLRGADLGGADFIDADLRGADLRGTKNLEIEKLITALHWRKALLDSSIREQAEILVNSQMKNGN